MLFHLIWVCGFYCTDQSNKLNIMAKYYSQLTTEFSIHTSGIIPLEWWNKLKIQFLSIKKKPSCVCVQEKSTSLIFGPSHLYFYIRRIDIQNNELKTLKYLQPPIITSVIREKTLKGLKRTIFKKHFQPKLKLRVFWIKWVKDATSLH